MKIVFIPGAYAKSYCWNYISSNLSVDDKNKVFLDYDVERPLKEINNNIKSQIQKYCGDEPIIIIGHSFGGVLAINIAEIEKIPNVKQVITLSAPIGGIESAKFLFNPFLHNFSTVNNFWNNISPTNPMFSKIRKIKSLDIPLLCVVVETQKNVLFLDPSDGIVTVSSQKFLEEKENLTYFHAEGLHMSGLLDDKIVAIIKQTCHNTIIESKKGSA